MLYYLLLPLAWVLFHLLFRVRVIGRENLKKVKTKGFIIAPTHVSALDPVFVVLARFWGRRMIIFAKKELFEINFLVSWFLRQCGGVMVRGTRDEVDSMNRTIDYCRRGGGLLLFPEGPREKNGEVLAPKSGVFIVADQAAVDVVPCRVLYDTPDGRLKLFCRVRVTFGEPMPAEQFEMEGKRDVKQLRANKQALLEAWQALGSENGFPSDSRAAG